MQNYSTQTPIKGLTAQQVARLNNKMMLARKANPTDMWGIAPWGIKALDRLTGGIQPRSNNWLGGRPGSGKSGEVSRLMCDVAAYFRDNQNMTEVVNEETGEVERVPKAPEDWLYVAVILNRDGRR